MGLLSSPLKITAGVGAVAAAPYLLGGIAPNITNVSAHVSQILGTAGTIVGTAAPLALPVFAGYRGYKKYKEKGLWHGIESSTLTYGVPAAMLCALGVFSAPYALTALGIGGGMWGARKAVEGIKEIASGISDSISRGTSVIDNTISNAGDWISGAPKKIWTGINNKIRNRPSTS